MKRFLTPLTADAIVTAAAAPAFADAVQNGHNCEGSANSGATATSDQAQNDDWPGSCKITTRCSSTARSSTSLVIGRVTATVVSECR
jgi:hypothetical protein